MGKSLAELLVEARLVTPEQAAAAAAKQAVHGGTVARFLVAAGAVNEEGIARFLASHLKIPLVDIGRANVEPAVVKTVPLEMAQRYMMFPTALIKDGNVAFVVLAMADPMNVEAVDAVKFKTGRRVRVAVTTESAVEAAIRKYHYGERATTTPPQSSSSSSSGGPAAVQFRGHEVELDDGTGDSDIPLVTGTPYQALPPTAATEVMSLADLPPERPPEILPDEPALTDASFSALAPPLSTLGGSSWGDAVDDGAFGGLAPPHGSFSPAVVSAPPLSPPILVIPPADVAPGPPNVRSTGSPAVERSPSGSVDVLAGGTHGTPESSSMVAAKPFCPDCGAERVATAKFCPHCGCSFTGVSRAKGAPPAVPPPTRPMMPAMSPVSAALSAAAAQLVPGAPIDVQVLEGLKQPAGATVVQLRPRTAGAANVDEPEQLGGKVAQVGLGVTLIPPAIVSDASRPDQIDAIEGRASVKSPVVPLHLHRVTEAMARVDDVSALAPTLSPSATTTPTATSAPKAAPSWSAPATLVVTSPVPGAAAAAVARANGANGANGSHGGSSPAAAALWNTEHVEGISRTSVLTAQAALVDDALGLALTTPFKIALAATQMPQFLSDASLVDDVDVLEGRKAAHAPVLRSMLNRVVNGLARVDDADVLAPKVSLAEAWRDAAERPIPRKDARNEAPVPRSRELLFMSAAEPPAPPPPPPEPKVEYIPAAPPAPSSAPAPWAVIAAAPPPAPAAAAPKAAPGLATMIMSLDDFEKQQLAERLRQKAADSEAKDKK